MNRQERANAVPAGFAAIFAKFPSLAQLAQAMPDVPYDTIVSWKYRGSIPTEYHHAVVHAAKVLGISGVSVQILRGMADDVLAARLSRRQASRAEYQKALARRQTSSGSGRMRF